MRLFLDVIEGPAKGQKLSLSELTSIGRKGADILFEDAKLSEIHLFFKFEKETGWIVVDNDSRNGVWVNGLKEHRLVLKDSDIVQVGVSKMVCRLLDTGAVKFSEKFQLWIQALHKKVKSSKNTLKEINPEVRLKVVQGVQYGESWDVFYGPRKAGRESIDICLYDDKAPKESFEIRVKGKYAYFYTNNEKIVKINNKSVKEKQFAPGDLISVGESQILVELDEGHGFSN